MIHNKFPEYENRIAVGIVGEGSDCFGFDDDISKDHDYELGFCMWLMDSDYEKIGERLQKEYELLQQNIIESSSIKTEHMKKRRGVFRIREFYENILQIKIKKNDIFLLTADDWLSIKEYRLAMCTNGEVFRDDTGNFTAVRNYIKSYYPEKVWRMLLAEQLHIFSQNAQYNYGRMMVRKDYLTAQICVIQAVKSSMRIIYLLNRVYSPYYKWLRKGIEKLELLSELLPLLNQIVLIENQENAWENIEYRNNVINKKDKKIMLFEEIALKIVEELNNQKIICGKNNFLDLYCMEIAYKERKNISEKRSVD